MQLIFKQRYSFIDLIMLMGAGILFGEANYLGALGLIVFGALFTVVAERLSQPKSRDPEWQAWMKKGQYIEAIRTHRTIYNSSLHDAKEAVDKYRSTLP